MTIPKPVLGVKASTGNFSKHTSLRKGAASSFLFSEDGSDSAKTPSASSILRPDDNETKGESSSEILSDLQSFTSSCIGSGKKCRLKGKNSSGREEAVKKLRRQRPWTICLTHCRYDVVRNTAKRYGLVEVSEDEPWNIYWTDFSISIERAMDMRRFQIINHFPGMSEICRKDLLARNLNRMSRLFGKDYDIYPKTWKLPADLADLQNYALSRRNKIYICKPEMGCQGRGIFLIRNIKELNPFNKIVCQLYIAKPFLIDSYKFDLRLYALITSCDPLRVYLYKEGLARFATAPYKPPSNNNTENSYMHLTNYAVNKFSSDYIVDDECGSKRKFTLVLKWLSDHGHDIQQIRDQIDDAIIKTILSAHPILKHNYRTMFPNHDVCSACFEILGFDILLDHKLKPYVLEVNHSPSFHTDAKLDEEIKEGLLTDTFAMINLKRLDRRRLVNEERKRVQQRLQNIKRAVIQPATSDFKIHPTELTNPDDIQFAHEVANCGGYRLIYPLVNTEKYDTYLEQNLSSLYRETAASQARVQCTKTYIKEYNAKKTVEESKRVGFTKEQCINKDKMVAPESPWPEAHDPEVNLKQKLSTTNEEVVPKGKGKWKGFLAPTPIVREEELERMCSIMDRGMLVRSLGIEEQAFKLLCHNGNIKQAEEEAYTELYGCARN